MSPARLLRLMDLRTRYIHVCSVFASGLRDCGTAVAVPFSRWLRYRVISYWIMATSGLWWVFWSLDVVLRFSTPIYLLEQSISLSTFWESPVVKKPLPNRWIRHDFSFLHMVFPRKLGKTRTHDKLTHQWHESISSQKLTDYWALQTNANYSASLLQLIFGVTYHINEAEEKQECFCETHVRYGWESEIFSIRITTLPQNKRGHGN